MASNNSRFGTENQEASDSTQEFLVRQSPLPLSKLHSVEVFYQIWQVSQSPNIRCDQKGGVCV